jgi:hypothetical protein
VKHLYVSGRCDYCDARYCCDGCQEEFKRSMPGALNCHRRARALMAEASLSDGASTSAVSEYDDREGGTDA